MPRVMRGASSWVGDRDPGAAVSALGRNLLRLAYGLPPDPDDAEEFGRIFDATPLYGLERPDSAAALTEDPS